ncbi:ComF family protein [Actinoplanes sp. TRM 88003]|uniref:ComF family protein n=1 Tax=Paractinoplanes aksuensis TaxID=2939490 RepID=A0ABT1DQ56_9ACTN|nr:phosphoribosyltransferase family protein [Actinoplanes aksuensis]MCO8272971.1 ComF family protein [Actinoplanes aksuensis]
MAGLLGDLADLVLPAPCAGCGAERVPLRYGVCAACAAGLEALRPFRRPPEPVSFGLPTCVAVGAYEGALRGALLAYKEKGRHRLARPLGSLLAVAVARIAPRSVPVTLVPVPSTAAASRERHGDHMLRLAAHTVRRLRGAGWQAEISPQLEALPRPDSTSLSVAGRRAAAEDSLRIRRARIGVRRRAEPRKGTLVVVDDIVTTGATLAAVTRRLEEAKMQVDGVAVLAATQLRGTSGSGFAGFPPDGTEKVNVGLSVSRTRGDAGASAR